MPSRLEETLRFRYGRHVPSHVVLIVVTLHVLIDPHDKIGFHDCWRRALINFVDRHVFQRVVDEFFFLCGDVLERERNEKKKKKAKKKAKKKK